MDHFETIVIGLGITGLSCVRYLAKQNEKFAVMDTRENPPGVEAFKQEFPHISYHFGGLRADWLNQAKQILVSPGVALETPELQEAQRHNAVLLGDIELFAQRATAPVAGITGSNGKTTVTTLLQEMIKEANLPALVGGNIGIPALSLLEKKEATFFALELSSFQLERTQHLPLQVATILNLAPDHMDRYETFEDYCAAKHRIYQHAQNIIVNRDDTLTYPDASIKAAIVSFGLDAPPSEKDFGILEKNGELFLAQGIEPLLNIKDLLLLGKHNWANALAALAFGQNLGIPLNAMLNVLKHFPGVAHRCEQVAQKAGVTWINDSKGTNVAATVTALKGMASLYVGKAILLAGGVGKNADFSVLRQPVAEYARKVIVFGQDAKLIQKALEGGSIAVEFVETLTDAIAQAAEAALPGDFVLFSPACASFDMFQDYNHRGMCFREAVHKQLQM